MKFNDNNHFLKWEWDKSSFFHLYKYRLFCKEKKTKSYVSLRHDVANDLVNEKMKKERKY